jgi:energy-coupling factor transporter ATP-binding protein EcfA2
MGAWELYNSSGLHKNAIASLLKESDLAEESYSIVAAIGVDGAGKTTLLNEVFGTTFPETGRFSGHQDGPSASERRGVTDQGRHSSPAATYVAGSLGNKPKHSTGRILLSRAEPLARSLILAQPPQELLVLDIDGLSAHGAGAESLLRVRNFASPQQLRTDTVAVQLGFALADIVVFNVLYHDLSRSSASGLRYLRSVLEVYLRLCAGGMLRGFETMPSPSKKRLILVVIRDFEEEEVSRDDVSAAFQEDFAALWARMTKPSRFANSRYSEFFSLEYAFMPSALLRKIDFMRRVGELQRRFLDPTADGYFFQKEGGRADGSVRFACPVPISEMEMHTESVFKALQQIAKDRSAGQSDSELGADGNAELEAAYRCDEISNFIFCQYLESVRIWKSRAEDGRIIENFGKEADTLLQNAIAEYERDAAAFRDTKSFHRKRGELRTAILNDLRTVYAKQLLKLREVAFDRFKLALTRVQVTDRVEKDVEKQIRENEKYFIEQADLLKCQEAPRGASASSNTGALAWRHDVERRALVDAMREVATERLQFARLQGAYVPTQRQPVQFSFHYLHPNPFGVDSRLDRLTTGDPIRYDPTVTRVATTLRPGSIRPGTDQMKQPGRPRRNADQSKGNDVVGRISSEK